MLTIVFWCFRLNYDYPIRERQMCDKDDGIEPISLMMIPCNVWQGSNPKRPVCLAAAVCAGLYAQLHVEFAFLFWQDGLTSVGFLGRQHICSTFSCGVLDPPLSCCFRTLSVSSNFLIHAYRSLCVGGGLLNVWCVIALGLVVTSLPSLSLISLSLVGSSSFNLKHTHTKKVVSTET